uniref:Uncharacterized protein n=1 Tax=Spironucleus salmonicida TaxID=348837 RepID=V6LGK8_9EUKA|eukprot:EST42831.1 Hypothetical protein SS50377_17516 [Spironucleus salmonicida]
MLQNQALAFSNRPTCPLSAYIPTYPVGRTVEKNPLLYTLLLRVWTRRVCFHQSEYPPEWTPGAPPFPQNRRPLVYENRTSQAPPKTKPIVRQSNQTLRPHLACVLAPAGFPMEGDDSLQLSGSKYPSARRFFLDAE